MKKLIVLMVIFFLFAEYVWSQDRHAMQIRGRVFDSATNEPLPDATVTCLYQKDSTKAALLFTDKGGSFFFDNLVSDKYILYITYVGYKSLLYPVKYSKEEWKIELGSIAMYKSGLTLSQVEIVKAKNVFRVAKDTIEFRASSFPTRENASLVDLLRRIPGVQIDEAGTIRVNGEVVREIRINGHSLFGGKGLSLIGTNLQADLIEKIQVIDGEKEEGKAEGISSIRRDKIVNLTIKSEKKRFVNGEISAGIGSSNRFFSKVSLSRFDDHQQIVLIENGDNINSDRSGSGGVEQKWIAGVSYRRDINKNVAINISYLMSAGRRENELSVVRRNFFGDSTSIYSQKSESVYDNSNHLFNLQIHYQIDTLQKITFTNAEGFFNEGNVDQSSFKTENNLFQELNGGFVHNRSRHRAFTISNSVRYDRKFTKVGRSLDALVSYSYNDDWQRFYNASGSSYQRVAGQAILDSINQLGKVDGGDRSLFLMINYKEPILKNHYFLFAVGGTFSDFRSKRLLFDYDDGLKQYIRFNDSLSSSLNSHNIQYVGKVGEGGKIGKFDYEVAVSNLISNMNNSDLILKSATLLARNVLLPQVTAAYMFSSSQNIKFTFQKRVQFPDINQLQPTRDYSNPLYIRQGNLTLKPAFSNSFSLNFNAFNQSSMKSLLVAFNSEFMRDQMVDNISVDSVGRQLIGTMNAGGGYTFSMNIDHGIPFKTKNTLNIVTSTSLSRIPGFLEDKRNDAQSFSFTQSIRYSYVYRSIFNCVISATANYNSVKYLEQEDLGSKYFGGVFSFDGEVSLPLGITFGINMSYRFVTGRIVVGNVKSIIVNAYLSKSFGTHRQFLVKTQGFDLLRQNINVSRNIGVNYFEDISSNVLQRFFILKASYFVGKK